MLWKKDELAELIMLNPFGIKSAQETEVKFLMERFKNRIGFSYNKKIVLSLLGKKIHRNKKTKGVPF